MKINKDLLPLKGHYFFFNAGIAPLYPTMPVYAKQLGFSSVVVGTIYTIFPICGVLAKPAIGALGDRFKAHKKLLLIFLTLIMTSYFVIQFVPGLPGAPTASVTVVSGLAHPIQVCPQGASQRIIANTLLLSRGSTRCRLTCTGVPSHEYLLPQQSHFDMGKKSAHSVNVSVQQDNKTNECVTISIDDLTCHENSTAMNCHNMWCTMNCPRPLKNLLPKSVADGDVVKYWQFWIFFILLFGSWVPNTVSVSLTDTICVEILGRQSGKFGNQRLWGSAGWGIMAIVSGFIVDAFSEEGDIKNYTPSFYLMLVPFLLDIFCSYKLKYEQTNQISRNIWHDVGRLFLNVRILVFMLWCTFIGCCFGMIWNFLFWYLEELADIQGGNAQVYIKTIEGLVGGIHCVLGEVPSYFFSGWLLKKIGHGHSMTLVLFLVAVRFLLYSLISDPWWVLPVSVLQAMNGLFFPTMTSYAKIVAEPGTEATVQGLVSALCEGVGVAVGSFVGGILVDSYGGATTFRIFAVAAAVMTVFNACAQYLLGNQSKIDPAVEDSERTKFEVSAS